MNFRKLLAGLLLSAFTLAVSAAEPEAKKPATERPAAKKAEAGGKAKPRGQSERTCALTITWWEVPAINKALRPILCRLAAHHLTTPDAKGRALDRVAHFHLGNGAVIERLNWLADTSANGFRQSYAMMVNYRYKLGDVDANHEAYANGRIVASREVRALAKG